MVSGGGARNKAQKRRKRGGNGEVLQPRRNYRKAGMCGQVSSDDSCDVNVHGVIPTRWVTLSMLVLNLVVWVDAAAQLAG